MEPWVPKRQKNEYGSRLCHFFGEPQSLSLERALKRPENIKKTSKKRQKNVKKTSKKRQRLETSSNSAFVALLHVRSSVESNDRAKNVKKTSKKTSKKGQKNDYGSRITAKATNRQNCELCWMHESFLEAFLESFLQSLLESVGLASHSWRHVNRVIPAVASGVAGGG